MSEVNVTKPAKGDLEQQERTDSASVGELTPFHRALIDSSLDAVVIIDKCGVVREFNKAAEEVFGHSRSHAVGKKMSDLIVPPDLRRAHDEGMNKYNRTGEGPVLNNRIEITAMRADGRVFPVELAIVPMEVDGEEQFVGWVRDITQRRQAAEALKRSEAQLQQAHKMEAVGKLAGGIAHDFNNSLTVLISYAEMMVDSLDQPHLAATMLEEILSSARDAARLTRQLMAVGRRQLIQLETLDMTSLVRKTCQMLGSSLPDNIVIRQELPDGCVLVQGDATSLRQVLVNLALNSKHAMPGGGEIHVALAVEENEETCERTCVLTFEDTGEGMPREVADQAFEPFFTTKAIGVGSGLGLSTVYGTVQQLGGSVTLSSELGTGTVVQIKIPIVEAVESEEKARRILVVDDQAKLRKVCRLVLEGQGFDVELASDGEAAMRHLREGKVPDLMVTDIRMPHMGGVELTKWLWNRSPLTPVVLISGDADVADIHELLSSGPSAFLAKPFSPNEFTATVERFFKA